MPEPLTRTAWRDETHALIKRLRRIPDLKHPSVRHLEADLDRLIAYGLEHEYLTPREATAL